MIRFVERMDGYIVRGDGLYIILQIYLSGGARSILPRIPNRNGLAFLHTEIHYSCFWFSFDGLFPKRREDEISRTRKIENNGFCACVFLYGGPIATI